MVGWFSVLAVVGRPVDCWWFIRALWDGTSSMTGHWRLPLPHWDWRSPTSGPSCRAQLLLLMALSYAAAIILRKVAAAGSPTSCIRCGHPSGRGRLGLAIAPQALFRPDTQHILQVVPPLLVVAVLLVVRLFNRGSSESDPQHVGSTCHAVRIAIAAAYLFVLVFPFACLRHELRIDLASLGTDLPGRYRALEAGLNAADPTNQVAQVARAVQRLTLPGEPILVTPLMPQVYFWSNRPMSGILNCYAGIFSQDVWRQRNLDAVRLRPPALLVADRDFLDGNPDAMFEKYDPELYQWLKARYRRVVGEVGGFVLIAGERLSG